MTDDFNKAVAGAILDRKRDAPQDFRSRHAATLDAIEGQSSSPPAYQGYDRKRIRGARYSRRTKMITRV